MWPPSALRTPSGGRGAAARSGSPMLTKPPSTSPAKMGNAMNERVPREVKKAYSSGMESRTSSTSSMRNASWRRMVAMTCGIFSTGSFWTVCFSGWTPSRTHSKLLLRNPGMVLRRSKMHTRSAIVKSPTDSMREGTSPASSTSSEVLSSRSICASIWSTLSRVRWSAAW